MQGNLSDVATLKNTMKSLDFLGTSRMHFVLDRGFYSRSNIDELLARRHHFTIALPAGRKWVEELIESCVDSIASPSNYREIDTKKTFYSNLSQFIKLYGFGSMYGGSSSSNKAVLIKNMENVADISGKYVLTLTGSVYELRSNSLPRKITGYRDENNHEIAIIKIAQGNNHLLALDVKGRVWSMGSNGYGQLGDGTWSSKSSPVLLPKFTQADKIVDISAVKRCRKL